MLGYTVTAPNSSCGHVMFSQACVKNSVHRGCLPREGGVCIGGWLLRGYLPGGLPGGVSVYGGACPNQCWDTHLHSTMGYSPQADSTHLSGMHSCLQYICKDDTVTTCLYPLF